MRPLFLLLCLLVNVVTVEAYECRRFQIDEARQIDPPVYADGLLWKVSRSGQPDSFIFGTIHVSDERVLQIPEPVTRALSSSNSFIMEAVPEAGDLLQLQSLMFYPDERRLSDHLDDEQFARTVEILQTYGMPAASVAQMQPWAAYLTMNYPINAGLPLDLVLMHMAQQQQKPVSGLEGLTEQLSALSGLNLRDQVQLLVDSLCNYDLVLQSFDLMISLYLQRDLKALYTHSQKYQVEDSAVYDRLFESLIIDRNLRMVERLQLPLTEDSLFVAIGALHLSGEQGVLALLKESGYSIELIY